MSSSREKLWAKRHDFESNGPFDKKTKKIFSQTVPLHQNAKKVKKLWWAVPGKNSKNGQTDEGYFIAPLPYGSKKTVKLSKLMSLFLLNKSQHKLTFFQINTEDVLPKIFFSSNLHLKCQVTLPRQNS